MKVLFIANNTDTGNGAGRYTFETIREMEQQGIVTKLLTKKELPLGRNIGRFFVNALHARRAARSVTVVHALDGWPYGVYGWAATIGTGKPLFISGIGTYSVLPLSHFSKRWLLRKAYRHAQKIFCISEYTKKKIEEQVAGAATEKVLMGAPMLPDVSEEQVAEISKRYALAAHHPIVLTVGSIIHRKGQLDTLKALAMLKGKYPELLYLIVGSSKGDPSYAQRIHAYADEYGLKENTMTLSDVSDTDLVALYKSADVFALNANSDHGHFEGFGLVFLEAAQFGLPSVGSRGSGIADAIKEGESGYLVPEKNHAAISKAVEKCLANKKQLAEGARHFWKQFSWEKMVHKYRKAYASALE